MESATESAIDLFAGTLPSMEQIRTLSEAVNSSEKRQADFSDQLGANMSGTGQKASLALGIGLCILGRYAEAVGKLPSAVLPSSLVTAAYVMYASLLGISSRSGMRDGHFPSTSQKPVFRQSRYRSQPHPNL